MLSVVLATHNEEANLEKCLAAVKDWADEIIVVDGESTDGTVKLAKKLGAKVISTTNKANFHINKQMAMDAAKGDVVLQLDADEVVDDELAVCITQLHQKVITKKYPSQPTDPVAWNLRRKNWFINRFLRKGGQYPDPVIRLYLKGKARLPQKDVHEQMQVDGPVGVADGHLLHYANPTLGDYIRKFQTYTSFKASQLADQKLAIGFGSAFTYLLWKPLVTFVSLFIRHKGFVDGVPGMTFALFSGLHHSVAYLKYLDLIHEGKEGKQ